MKKIGYLLVLLSTIFIFSPINNSSAFAAQKQDLNLSKLELATRVISAFYVDSLDNTKLIENAITGMLDQLDPHSVYISSDEVQKMNEPLQGNFEGIGIHFSILKDTLFVVNPIPGGPSEKVGIMAGDRIIYVNDDMVAGIGLTNQMVFDMLRGKKGTEVTIKITRRGMNELLEFTVERDKIPIYSLDAAYMLNKEIGYIKLNRFSATTHDEFKNSFAQLKQQGMKSLVLDLQGNGGGYLKAATDIVDEFIPKGQMIVYTKGVNSQLRHLKAMKKGLFEDGKLVVLIDESSASASEIVSGAIQDWDRGIIIGRRSFGKGLVQRPFNLPDGSMMRLTTAKYYTPTGRLIQKPYENGNDKKYHEDLQNRYKHGEYTNVDSIQFPDSLKFKTLLNKRTVYGGGGIMPDIFIPLDTTEYSKYHRNLLGKGIINKFVLSYIDNNRDNLKESYPDITVFIEQFNCKQTMLDELISRGEDQNIAFNKAEFDRSKASINQQIKALIARDLFEKDDFYRIINMNDNVIIRAIEILENPSAYRQLLKLDESAWK